MFDKEKKRAFIPMSVPNLKGNEGDYVQQCIKTEWVSSAGSFVNKFEEEIAAYTGAKYAVACVNGTAALHLSLLMAGVAAEDHILVPSLTFIAPINTVKYCNANPIFLDCDDYYNLDVIKLREFFETQTIVRENQCIYKPTGKKIAAIIPVHVFGGAVNMDVLLELCTNYKVKIIEDATESLGTYYSEGEFKGKHTGTIGDFGCLSFNGNKIITCGGGGMILTNNQSIAQKIKYFSEQAKDDAQFFVHDDIGFNYRLTNVQAAIGVAQLEQLDRFIATKKENFHRYKNNLANSQNLKIMDFPPYCNPNYWFYALQIKKCSRPKLREIIKKLHELGIQARPVWELNHRQIPYKDYPAYKISKAIDLAEVTLNIPCSSNLLPADVDYICEKLIQVTK